MTEDVEQGPAVVTVSEFRDKVQLLIGASTPEVVDKVIEMQVKQERDRRVGLLVDVLDRHAKAEATFKKLKPDFTVFEDDGVTVRDQGWTAPKKAERDKAKKALDRLISALNSAIGKGDFKALEDILNSSQKADEQS